MVTEITKGVYWVGITDWNIRYFHGYELSTHRGTTYNSYLILDEKNVLVDTVWEPFQEDLLRNIREVIDPAKVDLIVTNHSEPDHSTSLPAVVRAMPQAKMIVSKRGLDSVPGHFHQPWELHAVKTGDRISIGSRELIFVEAPMLHWPDSMFTYLTGSNLLMPNDAFGQHYATAFRFNDQVNQDELYTEAQKYYANILTPFSARVAPKIEELLALKLPVDMIAPSHGVIWRKDPLQIVHKYLEWAQQKPEPRVVILFDTMWNATGRMAEAIGDGLKEAGVDFKLYHASVTDRNDAMTEIFRSKAVLIGSSTLNNGLLPSIMPMLVDMKGLKFKNKIGAAFGSYGWSGESVKLLEAQLKECNIPLIREGLLCKWQPDAAFLDSCRAFGREVADAVKKS